MKLTNNKHRLSGISILFFLSVVTSTIFAETKTEQTLPGVKKVFAAPDFELRDVDGKLHRLADYRGKVVILNFWATWCPPCRYEMPSMERARKKIEGENMVILAVDVGEDEDTIFSFIANYEVHFPLLMDQEAKTIKSYPVIGLPTTYIIDPQGNVTHRVVGSREWDDDALLDKLRQLLPKAK
jgi:peroxiredoxin